MKIKTIKRTFKINRAVILGNNLGLEVHAGHGLTFKSAKRSKISGYMNLILVIF